MKGHPDTTHLQGWNEEGAAMGAPHGYSDEATGARGVSREQSPTSNTHTPRPKNQVSPLTLRAIRYHRKSLLKKIKDNVLQGPSKDSCWIWRGHVTLKAGPRPVSARLASWLISRRVLPAGKVVGNACGCSECINPKHLVATTPATLGAFYGSRARPAKGQDHPQAKLSDADVRAIWVLRKAGMKIGVIAKEFSVATKTVDKILSGERWAHLVS